MHDGKHDNYLTEEIHYAMQHIKKSLKPAYNIACLTQFYKRL